MALNRQKSTITIDSNFAGNINHLELAKQSDLTHFHWGLGMEQMIMPSLTLAALYTMSFYDHLHLSGVSIKNGGATAAQATPAVHDRSQKISLNLTYYF